MRGLGMTIGIINDPWYHQCGAAFHPYSLLSSGVCLIERCWLEWVDRTITPGSLPCPWCLSFT